MNKEEPIRDQAERLRKRIEKKETPLGESKSDTLPPRRKVHQQKKKKTKFKLKYPIIRLLALFFILLPIVSFSIYTINDNNHNITEPVSNEQQSIETVDFGDEEASANHTTEETENTENPISEPSNIEVEVPTTDPSSTPSANDKSNAENKKEASNNDDKESGSEMVYHKVQPNENLFRIAMKYYHSQSGIETIKKANGIQGNEIKVGETLKIPLN